MWTLHWIKPVKHPGCDHLVAEAVILLLTAIAPDYAGWTSFSRNLSNPLFQALMLHILRNIYIQAHGINLSYKCNARMLTPAKGWVHQGKRVVQTHENAHTNQ
jgi:hypothetical protein